MREKTSGLTMFHLNGYVKVSSATLTQVIANPAPTCRKVVSLHLYMTPPSTVMKSKII